eukprot:scaffold34591_cov32-Tisochrysis_lutea.AAC.4
MQSVLCHLVDSERCGGKGSEPRSSRCVTADDKCHRSRQRAPARPLRQAGPSSGRRRLHRLHPRRRRPTDRGRRPAEVGVRGGGGNRRGISTSMSVLTCFLNEGAVEKLWVGFPSPAPHGHRATTNRIACTHFCSRVNVWTACYSRDNMRASAHHEELSQHSPQLLHLQSQCH